MSDVHSYDIIIVGAGPAGISTALHLAQIAPHLIHRTMLLEKARHPRKKLCGGGILPDGEIILRGLGLDLTEVPHCDVDWAHFDYAGEGLTLRAEKQGSFAFRTIRRHEFDAWLANKARQQGFLIHENTTVKQVTVTPSGVVLATDQGEYLARVVVGADGSNSIVRRAMIPRESMHVARLLEIVTQPTPERSFHKQADAYFDFLVVPEGILGYAWDFPALEKGKPVRVRGIYDSNVHSVKAKSLREGLREEFQRHGLELEDYDLAGAPLRWFEARSMFAAPRLLLAGDAAGSDALLGEGISIALGYGAHAARAIRDAFAKNEFSFSNYKDELLHSELGKALRRRTWFAKLEYGLRSTHIQALLWRQLGPVIAWIARNFLIGWARRQELKSQR